MFTISCTTGQDVDLPDEIGTSTTIPVEARFTPQPAGSSGPSVTSTPRIENESTLRTAVPFVITNLDVEPSVGSVFETLLSKMPDNEVTRAYTRMGDVKGVHAALGFDKPDPGYTDEELTEYVGLILSRNDPGSINDGFSPPFFEWPADMKVYLSESNTYDDLGYDWMSVDSFAQSNSQYLSSDSPLSAYDVALGDFDPAVTAAALDTCSCDQPELRSHAGIDYFAWSDGEGRGSIEDRLKRPLYDHLGRGPHLLIREGEAYYSVWDGVINEHIEVILHLKSSLADREDYVEAVRWMSSLGLIAELTMMEAGFTIDEAMRAFSWLDTADDLVQGIPLLSPFQMAATGVGFDGERSFTGLVIVHENADMAKSNIERLSARFRYVKAPNRDTINNFLPRSYDLDKLEIQTSGRFLIARIYFTDQRYRRLMDDRNGILLHE